MRCAIVGAGLAGLGAGYFLKQKGYSLTFFDKVGIGGGASGCASGLMHPYVGKEGLRSKFASEAIATTLELIDAAEGALGEKVALRNGIFRHTQLGVFPDVKFQDGGSLIESGITLFMERYLLGLFTFLEGEIIQREVTINDKFDAFDLVILAMGSGFAQFGISLPVDFIKGQILTVASKRIWERSEIGGGHISPMGNGNYQIGSTYEHNYENEFPELEKTVNYLDQKIKTFLPPIDTFQVISCKAGVRVAVKGSYLPWIEKIGEKTLVFTGLGSRGLLYHGLYGRHLANLV